MDPRREFTERLRGLEQENQRLWERVRQLEDENARLRELLERARRAGKRQAAPFSKGPPKPDPKTPGRKPGSDYGPKAWRPIPEHIDEVVEAPLPAHCDHCGGSVELEVVQPQYQASCHPSAPM